MYGGLSWEIFRKNFRAGDNVRGNIWGAVVWRISGEISVGIFPGKCPEWMSQGCPEEMFAE